MITVDPTTLESRIDLANEALAAAEVELQLVLSGVLPQERADKTMISAVLRDILAKVTLAHQALADLRSDPPEPK